jgi:hypothetical protein
MFFSIPNQPMDAAEETAILLATGCPRETVNVLSSFAAKYRQTVSADSIQKNRKLGTRALVRIARRLARFPNGTDLNTLINRSLLAEFLPAVERMDLDATFKEIGIKEEAPLVRYSSIENKIVSGW